MNQNDLVVSKIDRSFQLNFVLPDEPSYLKSVRVSYFITKKVFVLRQNDLAFE